MRSSPRPGDDQERNGAGPSPRPGDNRERNGASPRPGDNQERHTARDPAREVAVRVVVLNAGESTSLRANERVARVEWNGRKVFYLVIVEDPVSPQASPREATRRPQAC